MKMINFVPQGIRERQANQRIIFFSLLATALGVVACGAIWLPLKVENDNLIAQLKASAASSQSKAAQSKSASLQSADAIKRVGVLNTLSATEINWDRAFALTGDLLPNDVTLSSYSYSTAQGTITLKMIGFTHSNLSFANFVQFLKADKNISAQKVEGYSYAPATGIVNFTVSLQVPVNQVDFSVH